MAIAISVVIATRNRASMVARLVTQLAGQDLREGFEIIVVDDGSPEPVGPELDALNIQSLRTTRIEWSGQAAARHHGAMLAQGGVLVFMDDDMQVDATFLSAHLARHRAVPHAVVLGHIQAAPGLDAMPLFERFHARQLDRWRTGVIRSRKPVRGASLCTGNVSMTRKDYLDSGGFDRTLRRSEDRELGIRLESRGCAMLYADDAVTVHCSDHADVRVWMQRAYLYGQFDQRIARLHPKADNAHPWSYWPLINRVAKPMVSLALITPLAGRAAAWLAFALAVVLDRLSLRERALDVTALTYALLYYAGFRAECGSFAAVRAEIRRVEGRRSMGDEWRDFVAAVRADHDSMRHYRRKYHGEDVPASRLPLDLVMKVGFQMLAAYRLMRLFAACGVPVVPMIISRLIRHLYGAEIHWRADLAPGVSVVHGVGLVISHAARVEPGCILFQNVTLGVMRDPRTGAVGAPRLGRDVHVAPGATILGPIEVGAGSKIAAGCVLMRSIPKGSLVAPREPVVLQRARSAA